MWQFPSGEDYGGLFVSSLPRDSCNVDRLLTSCRRRSLTDAERGCMNRILETHRQYTSCLVLSETHTGRPIGLLCAPDARGKSWIAAVLKTYGTNHPEARNEGDASSHVESVNMKKATRTGSCPRELGSRPFAAVAVILRYPPKECVMLLLAATSSSLGRRYVTALPLDLK